MQLSSAAPIDPHAPLISALKVFYTTLSYLRYIKFSDIIFPPPGGHENVDVSVAREAGFEDEVIDLMKHLPYLAESVGDQFIAKDTTPATYLNQDGLGWARDPIGGEHNYIAAHHLVLTRAEEYGTLLVYDTTTRKSQKLALFVCSGCDMLSLLCSFCVYGFAYLVQTADTLF